jgi:hypothetical protein
MIAQSATAGGTEFANLRFAAEKYQMYQANIAAR